MMARCFRTLLFAATATLFLNPAAFAQALSLPDAPLTESGLQQDLPNYIVINPNLSRSGRPTLNGLTELRRQGFRTILNIENQSGPVKKEIDAAARLGMKVISVPMEWESAPTDAAVDQMLQMMQDRRLAPLLIHCYHGRDRTGLMVGLYRVIVEKWPPAKAYEEMLAAGFRPRLQELDQYFRRRTGFTGRPFMSMLQIERPVAP